MNSYYGFTHILQGCFTGTGEIAWLPQCPWSNPKGYMCKSTGFCNNKTQQGKTKNKLCTYFLGCITFDPTSQIPECTCSISHVRCSTPNRNGHICVLNGALWNMEQVHSGICEIGLLLNSCCYLATNNDNTSQINCPLPSSLHGAQLEKYIKNSHITTFARGQISDIWYDKLLTDQIFCVWIPRWFMVYLSITIRRLIRWVNNTGNSGGMNQKRLLDH